MAPQPIRANIAPGINALVKTGITVANQTNLRPIRRSFNRVSAMNQNNQEFTFKETPKGVLPLFVDYLCTILITSTFSSPVPSQELDRYPVFLKTTVTAS